MASEGMDAPEDQSLLPLSYCHGFTLVLCTIRLSHLSEYLQRDDLNVTTILIHIED